MNEQMKKKNKRKMCNCGEMISTIVALADYAWWLLWLLLHESAKYSQPMVFSTADIH